MRPKERGAVRGTRGQRVRRASAASPDSHLAHRALRQNLPQAVEVEDARERLLLHHGGGERGFFLLERADFFLHRAFGEESIRDDRLAGRGDELIAELRARLERGAE